MRPAISVIVSTHNRARYLPEILRTLAAQSSDAPFEVIVIDNASTDETPALLDQWCRGDSRFRTAREARLGLSRGKNAGIRLARAPLLLFTDDDMRIAPNWIASYHALFERYTEAGVAGGPIVPIPHDLGEWPPWLSEAQLANAGQLHHGDERVLQRGEYVWGGNMAIRMRVFDERGFWSESIGLQGMEKVSGEDSAHFEDTEFQDRIRNSGGDVWFCPQAVVRHRVDRQIVTPRQVVSTAFARGRNAVWAGALGAPETQRSPDRRNAAIGLIDLAASLSRWALWALVFRLVRRRWAFERASGAAFASGRALDRLRTGRDSDALYRAAARVAFPARAFVLRATSDFP